ncbi:MAG: nucleotidyltransferase domain-containing protein [Spirochaetales bacterium]|nr:nucleotidyltransferase domain-containing protein [Spirochaetales bacterium]
MDSTINPLFEQKCYNAVKKEVLSLAENKEGRIFLFGSRAKGQITRGSDFDIGFEGFSDKEFRTIKLRMGLFWEESFVPYHLDLVNFNNVRDDFRKHAMETIELWKN